MAEAIESEVTPVTAPASRTVASKSKAKVPVKAAKPKKMDVDERIRAKIRATAPKAGGTSGSVEITSTKKTVLSKVKYVLTTGIEPFDDLVGSFPFGRVTEVFGLESCGKTQLVIRAAVRAQTLKICEVVRENGNVKLVPIKKSASVHVLYIDNEQSIDEDEKKVVDGIAMDVSLGRCDTVDQLFKMAEVTIDEVDKAQKEDPDRIYFVVVIVDTIASTSSKSEMEQAWGKVDFSRHAQQYRQGFRVLTRKINRVNVAMICTNQVGDSFAASGQKGKKKGGGMQPDDYSTFGGKALKFFASGRIFMQKMREYKINPKSKFANGMLIGFRSIKNRVKKPYREGRMVLFFGDEDGVGGGLDNEFSVLETLIYLKYAEIAEEGEPKDIKFKFKKHHIPTTTFGDKLETTLEEDAEQEMPARRGKKDPSIKMRAEWPAFYQAHRADVDAMYAHAIHAAFAAEVVPTGDEEEEEDEDDFEEE